MERERLEREKEELERLRRQSSRIEEERRAPKRTGDRDYRDSDYDRKRGRDDFRSGGGSGGQSGDRREQGFSRSSSSHHHQSSSGGGFNDRGRGQDDRQTWRGSDVRETEDYQSVLSDLQLLIQHREEIANMKKIIKDLQTEK